MDCVNSEERLYEEGEQQRKQRITPNLSTLNLSTRTACFGFGALIAIEL